MPLTKKKTEKAFKKNVRELMTTKPGTSRQKAINTYAKKNGVSKEVAKRKLALAAAYSIKRKK